MTIYETSKNFLKKYSQKNEIKNYMGSVIGMISKIFASTFLYPFNLIRSKQQIFNNKLINTIDEKLAKNTIIAKNEYGYFWNTVKIIYTSTGLKGFYKGLSPLLLRQIPGSSVFFYTYEYSLKILNENL